MKIAFVIVVTILTFVISPSIVLAETNSSPQPSPSNTASSEFTVQNEPSSIISLLKNFIHGFDSFLGGFIFYTPDPLADSITLKDNSIIPGVTKYRNVFYQITIPVLAIIIAGIAISKLGSDNAEHLKSFFVRLLIVIALFIVVPNLLSYSIQFNNLLVDRISTTQEFTGFINEYFDKSQEAISTNKNPSETFGIPSFEFSLKGGVFYSLGKFIVQILLFALTFIFLLCGFIYLGFQFVIRFASLLFLGVIYPIVLPFALSERTESIVYIFFKSWFTFLIEQPAFVLGFAITTDIFTSILSSQGPSVGLLFFYTGFLFFLGSVNVLVARIFGDAWAAMSTNMSAALTYGAVKKQVVSPMSDFKQGFFGGSISSALGRQFHNAIQPKNADKSSDSSMGGNSSGGYRLSKTYGQKVSDSGNKMNITVPPFSQQLRNKGLNVESENQKQGVVSVSGEAYKFEDNKNGLVSFYPTRLDAVQDGISEDKLHKVAFDHQQFIDLSSFNKRNPNPHNLNAMEEAKRHGKELNYAFITQASPPQRVKHFLELAKVRNDAFGVSGVIVSRQAANGTYPVIRMYSDSSYEKRSNL